LGGPEEVPNKSIGICAEDPIYEHPLEEFKADFEDQYRYAKEEIDPGFPKPMGKHLAMTIFVNSDHAHDTVTRHWIMGILVVVGGTPVSWMTKGQGAVATLTYSAEFCAMCTAAQRRQSASDTC